MMVPGATSAPDPDGVARGDVVHADASGQHQDIHVTYKITKRPNHADSAQHFLRVALRAVQQDGRSRPSCYRSAALLRDT